MNIRCQLHICASLLFAASMISPWQAMAAENDRATLPVVIERALAAYAKNGLDALIPALVRGGPLEGQSMALEQTRTLRRIETFYGAYRGYDVIHSQRLGQLTRLVYFILDYEKGAVFGKALLHGKGAQASVSSFNFHTNPEEILPPEVLFRQ